MKNIFLLLGLQYFKKIKVNKFLLLNLCFILLISISFSSCLSEAENSNPPYHGPLVLITNYDSNSISAVPINEDGSMGETLAVLKTDVGPHYIYKHPGLAVVYVICYNKLNVYSVNSDGILSLLQSIDTPNGGRQIVHYENTLYVNFSENKNISSYTIDAVTGELTFLNNLVSNTSTPHTPLEMIVSTNNILKLIFIVEEQYIYYHNIKSDGSLANDYCTPICMEYNYTGYPRTPISITNTPTQQDFFVLTKNGSNIYFDVIRDSLPGNLSLQETQNYSGNTTSIIKMHPNSKKVTILTDEIQTWNVENNPSTSIQTLASTSRPLSITFNTDGNMAYITHIDNTVTAYTVAIDGSFTLINNQITKGNLPYSIDYVIIE